MANDDLFYDAITNMYFTGNAEAIEKAKEELKAETKETLKNVSKRGSIEIPRGLSDEEVLKWYHDEEKNKRINKRLRCECFETMWKKYYKILGLLVPHNIDCDENGHILFASDWELQHEEDDWF